jgi:hypothetical protein
VIIRAAVLFTAAFAALLWYEAWYWARSRDRAVPLGIGFFAVVTTVVYRVAGAYLGLLTGRALVNSHAAALPAMVASGAGLLLGLWLASLALQVGQNAVRSRFGAPVQPIEFIRRGSSRRARR